MKEKIAFLFKGIITLVGGTIIGVGLLTLAFLVPVNYENMQESYGIMEKEGWYPVMPILSGSLDTYFHSFLPGVLDDATDAIMLKTAMEAEESNPLLAAMDMRGYSYYWHGYVVILRPLLSIFDYGEIRFLNCIGQMLLIFCFMHTLWKNKGWRYAAILFTSYVFLMPMATQMSLQFSWVFYIAYGGVAVLVYRQNQLEKKARVFLFFMVLGMLTSFFDLLTYPLYTWAVPMIWFLVVDNKGMGAWSYVKRVINTGISWIVGYAGMWVSKWILGGLILKQNIFDIAMEEVFFRAGVEEGTAWSLAERAEAMYANWKHYEYKIYLLLLLAWLLWIIYKSIRCEWKYNPKNPALLLIASSSVVWYFVLSNHTQGHHFFTYRIWGISILALLALWNGSLGEEKAKKSVAQLMCIFVFWGIVAISSLGLSFLAREDVQVLNGGAPYREAEISEGDLMTVTFTPAFPFITDIGVGIKTESSQGQYIISVYDGEELLYSESIELERLEDKTYITIPVNWKLDSGKTYEIQTEVCNIDGKTYVLVTENMELPLNEYGEASIGGRGANGQPIAGFVYRYRPLSRATLLLLTVSWMGVLAAVLLEAKQIIIEVFNHFIGKTGRGNLDKV